jgi:hypothetical protein
MVGAKESVPVFAASVAGWRERSGAATRTDPGGFRRVGRLEFI